MLFPVFSSSPDPAMDSFFFVVTSFSNCFCFPFIFTIAVVFPSNFIWLSFTSLYSVSSGCSGVILLNSDFGISVTGEPLSIMNFIGRLLTNADSVKNSGPLLFSDSVEWIIWFIEWIVSGDHSSSSALLVVSSCVWFILLLDRQHFAKWPGFPHFAHFFSLAGHSCCLDQFGAPHLSWSGFLNFAGLSPVSLFGCVFLLFTYRIFFSSSVSGESFNFSYMYSCSLSVIASTDMSLFLIFFFNS